MSEIKSIISTGQGILHLIQSAVAMREHGRDIKVITGWVPAARLPNRFINVLGWFIGKSNLAYGLRRRTPEGLSREQIYSCSLSEFYIQFLFILTGKRILSRDKAAILGWKAFGRESRRYIRNSQIFHVRSGAGRAGAINEARARGMKIIVDHSIAHPYEIEQQLSKMANESKASKYISISNGFWNCVLMDCEEADVLLVNSEYVKETFVLQGYPAEKIEVIQLGVDKSFYQLKKSYESDTIRLIFTGHFGLRKGANLIIDAAKILLDKGISFKLDIIGSISHEIDIPDWFKCHPAITLHGAMPQDCLKQFLADGDVYIFPTYVEGAAQSVKEAMAAGLPVITTVKSGVPVVHLENGYLIPDDNAAALADAIEYLTENEGVRKKIGHSAAETISTDHTWQKYGQKLAELYKTMLST